MSTFELIIEPDGTVRGLYSDSIPYDTLGDALGGLEISRASRVEPTPDGQWTADMSPCGGNVELGPFPKRRQALDAEVKWLREHRL